MVENAEVEKATNVVGASMSVSHAHISVFARLSVDGRMRCENESVDTKLLTRFLVKRIRRVSRGRSVCSSFIAKGIFRYSISLIGHFNVRDLYILLRVRD